MSVKMDKAPIYLKGTSEIWVHDIATGDLIGYSNKVSSSNFTSSVNAGEIRAGLGAPVVINIPDSATFQGEVTAADFSLEARQLATGGNLDYNGTVAVMEKVTASDTTLTLKGTPAPAYGESASAETYACYVGGDGKNYGVNPKTKKVEGFTAQEGTEYCVRYYTKMATAQELTIPTAFNPTVARVTIKMAAYAAQGGSAMNGSRVGNLYIHIPRAQFINGNVGVNGSQTEAATTPWTFSALSYDASDATCSECATDSSVLGYMVYAPCDESAMSMIKALVVVGNVVTVKQGETAQTPVFYAMDNGQLVTPNYGDLTFSVAEDGGAYAKVGAHTGIINGTAAGKTTITAKVTAKPDLMTTANVTVTAAA